MARIVLSFSKYISFVSVVTLLLLSQATAQTGLPDFTDLVEKHSKAVVNISTQQKIKQQKGLPPGMEMPELPEGSPWNDFFKKFFGDKGGEGGELNSQSLGSGFIIDEDGYIITNYHVVKDADEIIVRLKDRRELKAKIVGKDARSDIALLKVDEDDLPVVNIGDSDKLKQGEWTMAIGSPFGFDHSVSVGVVSAKGRTLPRESYVPFIQTDVAINPGNSGGPLFNLQGEVIGINSQIYSRTGGFMGLSFAIPINVAMNVVKQLKDKGKVSRGWLGVLIQDVNRELAESFKMKTPMGAVVLKVIPDSPAAKAKIKIGDVIVQFGDRKIHRWTDLPLSVGTTPVGEKETVVVIREGQRKKLTVKIEELPDEKQLAEISDKSKKVTANKLGISVENLSAEEKKHKGTESRGVRVTVIEDGPAKLARIRRGDIILMINNVDINSVKVFSSVVSKLKKGKSVPVLIQRDNAPVFLALKIPE